MENNGNRNRNRKWKDAMVQRWEQLVLMYSRLREHPTTKLAFKLLWELIKIVLSVWLKKWFDCSDKK